MITERFIATIQPKLTEKDEACLRRMASYFGRSNLWPSRHEIDDQGQHVFYLANEAERFVFTIRELQGHVAELQAGKAFDWSNCQSLR